MPSRSPIAFQALAGVVGQLHIVGCGEPASAPTQAEVVSDGMTSQLRTLGPRISVIGSSGSGKTNVGRAVAARLGVAFLEMDALRHGPGWTETPDGRFRGLVSDSVADDAWVVDGNYTSVVREIVWSRMHHRKRARDEDMLQQSRWAHLRVTRLRSHSDVAAFLRSR